MNTKFRHKKQHRKSAPVTPPVIAKPVRTTRWEFSACADTRVSTALFPRTTVAPEVLYTPEVWAIIQHIVQTCEREVGWWGHVRQVGSDYLIDAIYVPEQTVTGTETDIKPEAMASLAMEVMDENRSPSNLYYWGHSHVNMPVSPSGQDEQQVEEYLEDLPIVIRGIYNKKGASKVDVFDKNARIVHQCVHTRLEVLTVDEIMELNALLKQNVTERTYIAPIQPLGAIPDPYTSNRNLLPKYLLSTTGTQVVTEDVLSWDEYTNTFHFPNGECVNGYDLSLEQETALEEIVDNYKF